MKRKCFVIMPYGEKQDSSGVKIDFDDLYEFLIRGAIKDLQKDLQIDCVRCDKISGPGLIHKDMIREIFDADVAIVDITTKNANVFYELGVRQALRKSVTVVIQRVGDGIPFNLNGLRVIPYDPSKVMTLVAAREAIKNAIQAGLQSGENDSLVHEFLNLRVTRARKELEDHKRYRYRLRKAPGKSIGLITGSIEQVKNVDVWVNSENTDMQMARSFDGSISGIIRYLGATRNTLGEVTDDKIANALQDELRQNHMRSVPPTHVVKTTSGQLERSHNVKLLLHAATVQGAPGQGYSPVPGFARCVTNALELASEAGHTSIVFPIFCAGTARGDVADSFLQMFKKALAHLEANPDGSIKEVYFLAFSEDELWACRDVLDRRLMDVEEIPDI